MDQFGRSWDRSGRSSTPPPVERNTGAQVRVERSVLNTGRGTLPPPIRVNRYPGGSATELAGSACLRPGDHHGVREHLPVRSVDADIVAVGRVWPTMNGPERGRSGGETSVGTYRAPRIVRRAIGAVSL